jgi:hypothetical protein
VTRWESGELIAGRTTIRRYEQLLGLPRESLVTRADALRRTEPATARKVTPSVAEPDHRLLHELLDRATAAGQMTGVAWGDLTELIEAQPGLVLHPPRLWLGIAELLLSELVISEDSAWLQRQEAMSRLLEHRVAGAHAVAACIALADDRSSPVVVEPLSLLDVTAHADANRYLIGQVTHPHSERSMRGALLAAVRKVRHGHFGDADLSQLATGVVSWMAEQTLDQTMRALVVEVGHNLGRREAGAAALRQALRTNPAAQRLWSTGASAEPTVTRGVSRRVAALTQAAAPDCAAGADETLAFLVDETLHSPNPDKRLLASSLIAATPLREPFARALLSEITAELARRGERLPAAGLWALTVLKVSVHRPLVYDILVQPGFSATVRHAAAWATPHCAGHFSVAAWRAILARQYRAWAHTPSDLGEGTLHAITYGIGTDGHRELLAEIRADVTMPGAARATAHWLLNAPATIRAE